MTAQVAVRCYAEAYPHVSTERYDEGRPLHSNSLVLVFDTETTVDEYQNLLFGSGGLWINGRLSDFYIFYADTLPEKDRETIRSYASKYGYIVMSRSEFVDRVLYPRVHDEGAVCVGFNLPFDLSRLAIRATYSSKLENGFSLILSDVEGRPRIAVKSIDSKRAFISFMNSLRQKRDKRHRFNRGCFVDLKTLTFALTNKSYSLDSAARDFGCTLMKTAPEEHGKVTESYIGYNVNDVMVTHELYERASERYKLYCLPKPLNKLYSPASLGKAYLEKMGVKPFMEQNPDLPVEVMGHVMMTYYGGRTEVRVRRTPIKVSYLDFTSMYPTTYALLNMDRYLKANKITCQDSTRQTQQLLRSVTREDIVNPDFWPRLITICKIRPDGDILPVRAQYGLDNTYTIGVNHVTSNGPAMWYTLPDLIASKFLSGRTPIIEEAITFQPVGMQEGLREIEILPGIIVGQDKDFIKMLIEERIRLKKEMKSTEGDARHQLDLRQNILKIIANSTSYGIYIEVNARTVNDEPVTVYADETFETTVNKIETTGQVFNPIMAVFLTAGSRLILATAESLVTSAGGEFVYCDTDSIFITPSFAKLVQDFFRPLNPYSVPMEMFKVEEDDQGQSLDNVWFYGISAKRYVLYDRLEDGTMKVRKYSSHGLGGLV